MAGLTPLARVIASGLGSGLAPGAPGTAGSALAVVIGAGLLSLSPWALPAAIVLATLAGLWAIDAAEGTDDPGWVVIDEFAGQWLAMLPLATLSPPGLLAAFVLFRLFDIAKPGPVGWAERIPGAAGVMADDLVAGALAGALLWAMVRQWPGVLG